MRCVLLLLIGLFASAEVNAAASKALLAAAHRRNSGFSPTNNTTLLAWWSVPISGTANAASVGPWPDSSLASLYPLTTGSTKPTYATNSHSGFDSVVFNGTSSRLDSGGPSATNAAFTVFANMKISGSGIRSILGTSAPAGLQVRIDASGKIQIVKSYVALIAESTNTIPATNVWLALAVTYTATNSTFWVNGTNAGTSTYSSISLTGSSKMTMGDSYLTSEFWSGQLGDVGVYSSLLTTNEIASLQAWQMRRL